MSKLYTYLINNKYGPPDIHTLSDLPFNEFELVKLLNCFKKFKKDKDSTLLSIYKYNKKCLCKEGPPLVEGIACTTKELKAFLIFVAVMKEMVFPHDS